jgi:hypothetical protein
VTEKLLKLKLAAHTRDLVKGHLLIHPTMMISYSRFCQA